MKGTFGFGKFSIKLAIGYSPIHALIYLIGVLFTISFFVFINSTQSFVLKEFLNYPTERLGEATGKLVFYDELLSVLVVVSWGILSDHIGKYLVFSAGFAIISISLAIFTFAADLYPQLLLFRLLFALGGSACSAMMTAVLADIAFEGDRGKFSGLVGLTSGLGALVGVFGFLRLPTLLGLRNSYFIVAAISLISGILLLSSWVSLKKRQEAGVETLNEDSLSISSQSNRKKLQLIYFVQSFKKGIFAAKDTKILLGYFSSFLARSDSVSITLFIPLWIYKYYLENDLCGATFALDDPDIKTVCHEAYLRSSVLSGVTQVFALIGAPFFGYLSDKIYRPIIVLLSSSLAGLGYFLLSYSVDPLSSMNFLYLFFIGFGEIGLIVTSLGLVTHSSIPQDSRGAVAGIASFFGALGIMFCTRFGGYLFDWWSGAPFFLLGSIHALFLILGLFTIFIEANKNGGLTMESFRKMNEDFQRVHMD